MAKGQDRQGRQGLSNCNPRLLVQLRLIRSGFSQPMHDTRELRCIGLLAALEEAPVRRDQRRSGSHGQREIETVIGRAIEPNGELDGVHGEANGGFHPDSQ